MKVFITALALCWAGSVTAQVALPCGDEAYADNIPEPWDETTASFANGAVRVALIDTIEPASAAFYLLVLHPPTGDMGTRSCTLIARGEGYGYAAIFFEDLSAAYDPSSGLSLTVPAVIYLPEEGFQNSALLRVTINQSTGDVTVAQKLGRE